MSVRSWVYVGLGVLACSSIASAAAVDVRLAEAAKREDRSAIRTLIDQKADVNAPLADGSTALHWAVQADDLESVNLLLQAGANVKAANRYGVTPLHLATSNGNVAIIGRLLRAGADPDARDASGETLLMMAVRSGNIDSVAALVERGAAVNASDAATQTDAAHVGGPLEQPPRGEAAHRTWRHGGYRHTCWRDAELGVTERRRRFAWARDHSRRMAGARLSRRDARRDDRAACTRRVTAASIWRARCSMQARTSIARKPTTSHHC